MDRRRLEKLISELQSGNAQQRRAASYKLGKIKNSEVVPILIHAYDDVDGSVRQNVIEGLGKIGSKESIDFLNSKGITFSVPEKGQHPIRDLEHFLLGFVGWLVLSLFINLSALKFFGLMDSTIPDTFPDYLLNMRFAVLFAIQLLGLLMAYVAFRYRIHWVSVGIIFSSIPYLFGTVMIGTCGLPGFPFPLSIGMC